MAVKKKKPGKKISKLENKLVKKNKCGGKVRELRVKQGIKQKQLVSELNRYENIFFVDTTISKIEHFQRMVSDIEMQAFADFFGVTTDYLLSNENVNKDLG